MAVGILTTIFLFVLQLLQCNSAQECLYQYMHQPSAELHCNPYGKELQLHCGLTGPLSPEFNLKWYSSNATDSSEAPLKLDHSKDYMVNNIVLDWKTGHYVRSVSSALLTAPISEGHKNRCLWCQAEFDGIAYSLKSNVLCIKAESSYHRLDKCNDALIVNTSLVCANVTKDFFTQLEKHNVVSFDAKRSTVESTPTNPKLTTLGSTTRGSEQLTIVASPSISQTIGLAKTVSEHKQSPSLNSLHTISMETDSGALPVVSVTPTPPIAIVVPTPAGSIATTTMDTPKIKTEGEGGDTSEGGLNNTLDSNMKSQSGLEGPLYAAIVFCIVFVIVIVLLVVVIVCLSKRKCECFAALIRNIPFWKKTKDTSVDSHHGHALRNTIVAGTDMHSMLESGLNVRNHSVSSYKEDTCTDRVGTFRVRASVEIAHGVAPEQCNTNTDSSDQHVGNGIDQELQTKLDKRKSRTSVLDYPPPILPPKPRTNSNSLETSSGDKGIEETDKCDYDHLHPVVVNNNDAADEEEEHQYAELEQSAVRSPTTNSPPKKPPRSKEHFYHTLESSEESGLLHSASNSQAGSQTSGMNEYYEEEVEETNVAPGSVQLRVSNRLQGIFDDPRYAMLFVDQDHLEHIHMPNKNEVSRSQSTPSLVAVDIIPFSPTSPERRSLRATQHKRFSVVNAQLVHHHQ